MLVTISEAPFNWASLVSGLGFAILVTGIVLALIGLYREDETNKPYKGLYTAAKWLASVGAVLIAASLIVGMFIDMSTREDRRVEAVVTAGYTDPDYLGDSQVLATDPDGDRTLLHVAEVSGDDYFVNEITQ